MKISLLNIHHPTRFLSFKDQKKETTRILNNDNQEERKKKKHR